MNDEFAILCLANHSFRSLIFHLPKQNKLFLSFVLYQFSTRPLSCTTSTPLVPHSATISRCPQKLRPINHRNPIFVGDRRRINDMCQPHLDKCCCTHYYILKLCQFSCLLYATLTVLATVGGKTILLKMEVPCFF